MFGESITKININFLAIVITITVLGKWLLTGNLEGAIQVASVLGPIFTVLATCYTGIINIKKGKRQGS